MQEVRDWLNQLAAGRDLDKHGAKRLMFALLEGRLTEGQIGAVLMGLKVKGESIGEIAAFASVMREKSVNMSVSGIDAVDTCGTGGDGLCTFNISTLSALITAAAGGRVAKHGNRGISSRCGSADVLTELGVDIEASPEEVRRMIREIGIGFLFAPKMHQAMRFVMPVRRNMGIRTVFNILGPLTNPARVRKQVIGVFDTRLCDLYAEVLMEMGHEEAFIVHGEEGMDEISVSGPTRVLHLKGGRVEESRVHPSDFGVAPRELESIRGGTAAENARMIRNVLEGEKGARRDAACMNAAFAIRLCGIGNDLADAFRLAGETLDSGKANELLERWTRCR